MYRVWNRSYRIISIEKAILIASNKKQKKKKKSIVKQINTMKKVQSFDAIEQNAILLLHNRT